MIHIFDQKLQVRCKAYVSHKPNRNTECNETHLKTGRNVSQLVEFYLNSIINPIKMKKMQLPLHPKKWYGVFNIADTFNQTIHE